MDWPNKRPRLTSVASSHVNYEEAAFDWPNKRPRLTSVVPLDVNYEDFDLHTAQLRNDRRLKSKFESIFYKYERDFTGVGDEIDLETGEIVIDNGHISGMRDEQDVGEVVQNTEMSGSSLLRALTEGPEDHDTRAQSRNAQTNGKSLMRALTVAPEDPDAPFRSVELDNQEELSDEEGDSFVGDEWDESEDKEEYGSKKQDKVGLDKDGEDDPGANSSDSDDSILGPKKTRRPVRDVDLMPPPSNNNFPDRSRLHNPSRQDLAPSLGGPSLGTARDPVWRAPPLPCDNSNGAPQNDPGERSRSPSYTSPNGKSLWAPVYTRRPRKKKNDIRPSPSSNPSQDGRQDSSTRHSSNPATVHQLDEESDDPLQDDLVTTPASAMKSSVVVSRGQKGATFTNTDLAGADSKVPDGVLSNDIEPKEEHDPPRQPRRQTGGSPGSPGYHIEPGPGFASYLISRNHRQTTEHDVEDASPVPLGIGHQNDEGDYELGSANTPKPGEAPSGLPDEPHGSATETQGYAKAISRSPDEMTRSLTKWGDQSNGSRNRGYTSEVFKRRPLTKEQDGLLVRLRERGVAWREIIKKFPPGVALQKLQDRYYGHLSPSAVERKSQGLPRRRTSTLRSSSAVPMVSSSDGYAMDVANRIREISSVDTDEEIPTTPLLRSAIEPFLNSTDPLESSDERIIETSEYYDREQEPIISSSFPRRTIDQYSVNVIGGDHGPDQWGNISHSSPSRVDGQQNPSRSHGNDRETDQATQSYGTSDEPPGAVSGEVDTTVIDNTGITTNAEQTESSIEDGLNNVYQPTLEMTLHSLVPRMYHSPYAPIVYDPALDVIYDNEGTRRYRRLLPMPSKTGVAVPQPVAANILPGFNEAAANGGYGMILDYGRGSSLRQVQSPEGYPGVNVIDFSEESSDQSSQRSRTVSAQGFRQDGDENIDPRLSKSESQLYKEKLRQNGKRSRRQASLDRSRGGEVPRKSSGLHKRCRDRNQDWQALVGSSASPQPFQDFSNSRPSTAVSSVTSGSEWGHG